MSETQGQLDRLMAAAHAGDAAAYRGLLERVGAMLRGYFRRRIADPADAEDLVQTCLIAVHEKRATHDPGRPVAPWLWAIARYKLADHWRRVGRNPATEELGDWAAPSESFAARDVDALLGEIAPAQAEAIRMTHVEGLTIREASQRTGVGISALKLRVHRGMSALKALARR
jgi:RNA polymerase sigma-70 factor (ECF subfamily)